MPVEEHSCVVACLGSSSTAGKGQAFNWIGALQNRLGRERFVLRNFGVGGDLAYNALQRLSQVIESNPQKVVVLIGANDVLGIVSPNLRSIVRRLKEDTSADLALCSLAPIGEDLDSTNPFQREINLQVRRFSSIIREIATEENIHYIDV